ncbi:uncharacterized protein [Typha latifolia]|uniref:uncharacterized protein n=1 Tax=Typha latifolia TaxID=4733 RepID=UPI003C307E30
MSIALARGSEIERSKFLCGVPSFSVYEATATEEEKMCSSSSIGKDSDSSAAGSDSDSEEAEVLSSFKGPLETMEALEESPPVRRGFSKFYCGKSKSFANFADISSSTSVKDLAKPENPYTRKRKNLSAFNAMCEKTQNKELMSCEGGIAKRPTNASRSPGAPVTGSSSASNSSGSEEEHEPSRLLPPLHPQGKPGASASASATVNFASTFPTDAFSPPTRSISMADLKGVPSSGSSTDDRDKQKKS